MTKFISFNDLSDTQLAQYHDAISKAFPRIIRESPIIKKYWPSLENYFPERQHFLLDDHGELIGFINAVPFHFDKPLSELPDRGWDWMLVKGINGYTDKVEPNYIGGLQVIVRKEYQGNGYSKKILNHSKRVVEASSFSNIVIPIRPTKKHLYPEMMMSDYIKLKDGEKIYDPWIRTHVNCGAEIIKICEVSMFVEGDLKFWEDLIGDRITSSGHYLLAGALAPIKMDLENNKGEYREPNIWIKYSK